MLKIEQLSVQYQGNPQPTLHDFNLSIDEGEIVCIVGESGSGKSTVLRTILGALPKKTQISGTIQFEEMSLLQQSVSEWQKMRGTVFSMIFQDSTAALNPIRKIGKQYEEYIRQHESVSSEDARKQAEAMLAKMQLRDARSIMDSYPHQLSGGMCQRVGIALAMTFNPRLLLADEPTSALDVVTQEQIVEQLLQVREQFSVSVLLVTHNVAMAAHMADRLIVMENGKIVDQGSPLEVITQPKSAYTKKLLASVPELKGAAYV